MKIISKILLTASFLVGVLFAVSKLCVDYSDDGLVFIILAFTMFCLHLFAWIAPKTFFKLCWKITETLPDNLDYDAGIRNLEICDIVILISSNIFLGIVFLVV